MSILHFVHATKKIQTILIIHHLGIAEENLKAEDRGNDGYYIYTYGTSARGIDLILENNILEIRTTTLANRADYDLANAAAKITLDLFGGKIFNEQKELLDTNNLFDKERIELLPIQDANTLMSLCKLEKSIGIYCPRRKVHFGYYMYKQLEHFEGSILYYEMYKVMHSVQYGLPDYACGGQIRIGEGENAKLIKVLSNKVPYIVDDYDYIILDREAEKKPLMITIEILRNILPHGWKLMDERTFVAPIIEEDEWLNLIKKATPLNIYDSYFIS